MAKQTQLRRGTSSQQSTFVGAAGEVSVDTTNNRISVHNGVKAGGFKAIHENGDNGLDLTLTGNANLTAKNITLKDSTLDSSLSISSSGIRMRDNNIDKLVINGAQFTIKDNSNNLIQSDRVYYDGANIPAVYTLDRTLRSDAGNSVVDWGIQGLYDTPNTFPSIDWTNRQLYESGGNVITLDWNNNTLWRNVAESPVLSLDWKNQKTYDQAGIQSIDWNNRRLVKSDGGTISIDWEDETLNHDSLISLDWSSRMLRDNNADLSIHWSNRVLYDTDTISLDWDNRRLYDTYEAISAHWSNRQLIDSDGSTVNLNWSTKTLSGTWNAENIIVPNSINSSTRVLRNSSNATTIDWQNKVLSYDGGNASLNWNTLILNDPINTQTSLDWGNRKCHDAGGIECLDWNNQILRYGGLSLNWNNRYLYDNTDIISLDWQSRILSGNWTVQNLIISGQNVAQPSINSIDNDLFIRTQMGAKGLASHANSYALNSIKQKLVSTGLVNIIRGGDGFTDANGGIYEKVINNLLETYGTGGVCWTASPRFAVDRYQGASYLGDWSDIEGYYFREHFGITSPTGYLHCHYYDANTKFLIDTFSVNYVCDTGAGGMIIETGIYPGSTWGRATGINASGSSLRCSGINIKMSSPNFYQMRISGSGNTSFLRIPLVSAYNSTASSGRIVYHQYNKDQGPTYNTSLADVPGSSRTNIRDVVFSGINPDIMFWLFSNETSTESGCLNFFNTMKTKWPQCQLIVCGLHPYSTNGISNNAITKRAAIKNGYPYFDGYNSFIDPIVWSGRGFGSVSGNVHPTNSGNLAYGNMLWNWLEF
jgi:hypothetical protein